MQQQTRRRIPVLPSVAMVLGMLITLVGLAMLLLKVGGATLLNLKFSGLDVTTTSDAIAVMLIGVVLTLGVYFISAWVDAQWGKSGADRTGTFVSQTLRKPDDGE